MYSFFFVKYSVPTIKSNESSSKYSSAFSTLPAKSSRISNGQRFLSASSEPNIIDLSMIDRITKYGEISPNSRKLNDDEILQQPIVHNLDSGKYIPLSDANPMTQTIMERVHGRNSITSNFRKTSSDMLNLNKSEPNLSRQKSKNNNDNQSTSSASSSTKSSQTTVLSLSAAPHNSSPSSNQTNISVKKKLTNLVMKNILRRKKPSKKKHDDEMNEIDDEEDSEKLLINDGLNGDLKYKASRYLKEQAQFDRTQLLQTIVDAHDGPIWCMR